jgi:mono/diheme cytochrome c family protein
MKSPLPTLFLLLAGGLSVLPFVGPARTAAPPGRGEPHRSPVDLALLPDGKHALTANSSADSLSLINLAGGPVLTELSCGQRPSAVACSRDGKRAAVSNLWSGSVSLFTIAGTTVTPAGTVAVGPLPRGLAFSKDGQLFAAVSGANQVVTIDFPSRKVTRRWAAPREPWQPVLSDDGRHLAVGGGRGGHVRLWALPSGKVVWTRKVEDGFNLRGLAFPPDGQAVICAHVIRRSFPVSKDNIDKGWVIDSRLTRLPLRADAEVEQVALDKRGKAVGDPYGLLFAGGGRSLAVSASGTHELLLLQAGELPWSSDPGDHLSGLMLAAGRFRRVALGGRPMAMALRSGTEEIAIANYLLDAVQIVDVRGGKLVRTVGLGGPKAPGLARQGEALYYDAQRSHHQWFSCHTCHPDGHTSGQWFDTLNDGSYGSPKLTPSLRGVTRTGPWTWHGWQKDLGQAVSFSYTTTMYGPEPTAAEVKAVLAYLATIDHPPSPHRQADGGLTPAAKRGQLLFEGKARCVRCHKGPEFTSATNYDVKLERDDSEYDKWSPPTLRSAWDRGPYLHDARAATLEDVLTHWHSSEKLGGAKLTAAELRDLIAYLESL